MLGAALVYAGLLGALWGCVSLVRKRPRAGVVAASGLGVSALGLLLPARQTRIDVPRTRLDAFAPVFEFHEVHTLRVRATPERVYAAVRAVSADEILFFRALTSLRRLGRPGPESILNAPERLPLLDVATRTSFLLLAEEPGKEIVIGTVVLAPEGTRFRKNATPELFRDLEAPGFAKATMHFLVEAAGEGICLLRTETRVHATDAAARRRFAAYWRMIYPGSALIRRSWLRAIGRRAEAARP